MDTPILFIHSFHEAAMKRGHVSPERCLVQVAHALVAIIAVRVQLKIPVPLTNSRINKAANMNIITSEHSFLTVGTANGSKSSA